MQAALAAVDQSLKRINTSPQLYSSAATTFFAAGQFERGGEAFEAYLTLKRVDPTWAKKYAEAQVYLSKSRSAEAEAAFRQLADSADRNLSSVDLNQFYARYAQALVCNGKTEEARKMLVRLQGAAPMDSWSYKRHLSLLLELSGHQEKALELTKQLIAAPEFFARDPSERDSIREDWHRLEHYIQRQTK